jgi:hypothetical protein
MNKPLAPQPKVWEDIHHAYVAEHIEKALRQCEEIADALVLYAETGRSVYWKDARMLINDLETKVNHGSLARVREVAYFVCETCDSDICDHAERFNL